MDGWMDRQDSPNRDSYNSRPDGNIHPAVPKGQFDLAAFLPSVPFPQRTFFATRAGVIPEAIRSILAVFYVSRQASALDDEVVMEHVDSD
jgi:hypothetical protein